MTPGGRPTPDDGWETVLAAWKQDADLVGPTGTQWLIRELSDEIGRLRRLTGDGVPVSVDVGTDDDPYARLWGRTAGWNDSGDGPVLLVEIDQEITDD